MTDVVGDHVAAVDLPDGDDPEDRRNRCHWAVGNREDRLTDRDRISEARAAELRRSLPDDPVELAAGMLACAVCGQAVDPDDSGEMSIVPLIGAGRVDGTEAKVIGEVRLSLCPRCTERRQYAVHVAGTHPQAGRVLGGAASTMIEHVFVALDLLGKPLPGLTIPDAELGSLVRNLARPGADVTWMSSPRPGLAAPFPFGHVRTIARAHLLRGWVDHQYDMAAMNRPDVPVRPPSAEPPGSGMPILGGCLLCGVDHVDVPARRANRSPLDVWVARCAVSSAALGGPATAAGVRGWTCPECSQAIQDDRSIGPSAIRLAVTRWAEAEDDRGLVSLLNGPDDWRICGWSGLAVRARLKGRSLAASPKPWYHLDRSDFQQAQRRASADWDDRQV